MPRHRAATLLISAFVLAFRGLDHRLQHAGAGSRRQAFRRKSRPGTRSLGTGVFCPGPPALHQLSHRHQLPTAGR